MKIYTYYQDINHPHQNKLIEMWKTSWSRNGYTPVVLDADDAKNHPFFEEFDAKMREIFHEITDKHISDYGMSCWHRWLAYATQEEEKCYVCDYDVINACFPVSEPRKKLHLMDSACPCLVSGTPSQFEALCKVFIEVSESRMKILKQTVNHYHDQEFFQYNFTNANPDWEAYQNKYNIILSRNRHRRCGSYDIKTGKVWVNNHTLCDSDNYEVFHVSHASAGFNLRKHNNKKEPHNHEEVNELRLRMVEAILKQYENNS